MQRCLYHSLGHLHKNWIQTFWHYIFSPVFQFIEATRSLDSGWSIKTTRSTNSLGVIPAIALFLTSSISCSILILAYMEDHPLILSSSGSAAASLCHDQSLKVDEFSTLSVWFLPHQIYPSWSNSLHPRGLQASFCIPQKTVHCLLTGVKLGWSSSVTNSRKRASLKEEFLLSVWKVCYNRCISR